MGISFLPGDGGWWMEQPAKALASRSGRQTPTAAKSKFINQKSKIS
ncbi:MAG: hypothetical protein IPG78_09730 [Ignavibacteria bacterium]|nr:hypothetical protein [Ignavibacteria bacterium]